VSGQTSPATPGPALPPLPDRLSGVMSSIAAQARRTNLTRTADLGAALGVAAGGGLDTAGWADAERTAHQLAGSAGTFGFDVVSEIARSLERFCADASVGGGPDPVRLAEARALLDRASAELADGLER
jgi:HPt (histidine-containing phosphotransfer) domain-containing protein